MKAIVCLDDNNGIAFNHRRQSQDRAVWADIMRLVGEESLCVEPDTPDSLRNFAGGKVIAAAAPFSRQEGYCLIERWDPAQIQRRIDTLILYRWNRVYPADVYCTIDTADGSWELKDSADFRGYSHAAITREIYRRVRDNE